MLLRVADLHKSFDGVKAVDGVDFEVAAGELVALIGPNGAGKTTCFNCVNGQLRPDAGSVRLDGEEIVGLAPRVAARRGVGRTFQITAAFGSLTVRENVQTALLARHRQILSALPVARRLHVAEADALLDLVGLRQQAEEPCGSLAYGDLKRVELAVALAPAPRLLLMDEPTAGMTPRNRIELMRLVHRIAKDRSIGVLFTEHDMDVVFGHADRVLVMARGRLIAAGAPDAVRDDARVRETYLGG